MNIHRASIITVVAVVMATSAVAQEKKIKRSDLPPAVEKTVAAQSAGATVKGFSTEKEKGQTYYEAEMVVNGHSKDILIDTNGAIVEVEEEVAMNALPADVKAGLQAKAREGTLGKVESITKKDKVVAYEAKVTKDGKKSEIQVGPDGKPLDHEE
jgi:predicted aspartyl protease